MIKLLLTVWILIQWGIIMAQEAVACPACAVSSAQKDSWQTFWILSVMGILPLVMALIIGICIVRVQKNDKTEITHL